MVARKRKKFSFRKGFLLGLVNGLLIWLVLGFLVTVGPLIKAELDYRWRQLASGFCVCPTGPVWVDAPDLYFSLVIPKIEAQATIIANVDAGNPKEYTTALKNGVAHAKGTVFPGMKGTIFLFAHSTDAPWDVIRYNAVFYLLRELEGEDEVIIFFQGKRFNYRVTEKKIAGRGETDFFSQKDQELLVLQTCWPPGTTQKALLVFGKRIPS